MTIKHRVSEALAPSPNIQRWTNEIVAAAKAFDQRANLATESLALDIAAIMDRENEGENTITDGGHGRGLMQIDDRSWGEWLAQNADGLDPASNVMQGTHIYTENVFYFAGRATELGLTGDLVRRCAMAAYNAGRGGVLRSLAECRDASIALDPDRHTAKGWRTKTPDYSADCMYRRAPWLARLQTMMPDAV